MVGRYLLGLLFLVGFVAKVIDGWLWSDAFLDHLNARLIDPPPLTAFQQMFLTQFVIPHYFPLGWVVTLGELPIALGLLFSVRIRFFAISAVAMMIGFAAGGYVDVSTMFLMAFAIALAIYPLSGRQAPSL
ncbi:MAG: DoxX family protein [Pseudomonadota bacterium]